MNDGEGAEAGRSNDLLPSRLSPGENSLDPGPGESASGLGDGDGGGEDEDGGQGAEFHGSGALTEWDTVGRWVEQLLYKIVTLAVWMAPLR